MVRADDEEVPAACLLTQVSAAETEGTVRSPLTNNWGALTASWAACLQVVSAELAPAGLKVTLDFSVHKVFLVVKAHGCLNGTF